MLKKKKCRSRRWSVLSFLSLPPSLPVAKWYNWITFYLFPPLTFLVNKNALFFVLLLLFSSHWENSVVVSSCPITSELKVQSLTLFSSTVQYLSCVCVCVRNEQGSQYFCMKSKIRQNGNFMALFRLLRNISFRMQDFRKSLFSKSNSFLSKYPMRTGCWLQWPSCSSCLGYRQCDLSKICRICAFVSNL